jgi:hypothetical protein
MHLTTQLHVMSKLGIGGAVLCSPIPLMAWAFIKHMDKYIFSCVCVVHCLKIYCLFRNIFGTINRIKLSLSTPGKHTGRGEV